VLFIHDKKGDIFVKFLFADLLNSATDILPKGNLRVIWQQGSIGKVQGNGVFRRPSDR
jgi:hypothetical protein